MDPRLELLLRLLQGIARSGAFPIRSLIPSIRDPISQLVVEALLVRGPSNVSQLAAYVKDVKGSSSRMTVRVRLSHLEAEGIASRMDSSGRWYLRDAFLRRYMELLSLVPDRIMRAADSVDEPARRGGDSRPVSRVEMGGK